MVNDNKVNTSPLTLPIGLMIHDRYEVKSVIGIGGFGITYKCYDIYNKNICAVKEMFINNSACRDYDGKSVLPYQGKERLFEHGVARFMEEAGTLQRLNGTPHVVKITDYFKENRTAYFTMEYIDGYTLRRAMVERGGKFAFAEAVYIMKTIGRCLDSIHKSHKIFHRDISPENIMLDSKGEPWMIDFGNAKNYMRNSDDGMSIVLKPGFAPPEQYTGKDQGPWTDVYSLAGVFYYMASGVKVPPSTERLTGGTYEPLASVAPECGEKISKAVDAALRLKPNERTRTVAELIDAFEDEKAKTPEPPSDGARNVHKLNMKMPYIVVSQNGQKVGKWRLPPDEKIILGREKTLSNIIVGRYDDKISKQHCIISYDSESGAFYATDISTNGTFWRGQRMKKESEYKINAGEQLVFGNNRFIIEVGVQT